MAKGCWCDRLLSRVMEDSRLVLAPIAARFVWLALMRSLRDAPEPGVLRLPSWVRQSSQQGSVTDPVANSVTEAETRCVARLARVSETEAGEAMAYLLAEGLCERRVDGAILFPEAVEAGKRAAQARINGAGGGRLRRDGAPPNRSQGHLPLPINGTQETQNRTERATEPETPRAPARAALPAAAEDKRLASKAAREVDGLQELAGIGEGSAPGDARIVLRWMQAGITVETMREVISERVAQSGFPGCRTLGYFEIPMRGAAPAAPSRPLPQCVQDWNAEMKAWRERGGNGTPPKPSAEVMAWHREYEARAA